MSFQLTDAQKKAMGISPTPKPTQPATQQPTAPAGGLRPPTHDDLGYLAQAMAKHTAQSNPTAQWQQVQTMLPKVERGETISFDEAQRRSMAQLQPMYENQLAKTHKAQERDAIKRGFFGQLPTEGLKARAANESAQGLATATAASANDMVSRSEQMAEQRYQFDTQTRQQNAQMLQNMFSQHSAMVQQGFQNLQGLMEYSTKIDDMKWQREQQQFLNEIQEASVTGIYKGNMTADMQRFMEEMGLKREMFDWSKTMDQANLALRRATGGGSGGGLNEMDLTKIASQAFAFAAGKAGKIEDHLPVNALGRKDTSPSAWLAAERKHQQIMDYFTNLYYTRIYGGLLGDAYDTLYSPEYSEEPRVSNKEFIQNTIGGRLANAQNLFDIAQGSK